MISLPVTEFSQVGAVRRRAVQEAEDAGLTPEETERLAILVTEAGTNLVRHAQGGEILLGAWNEGAARGFDVISLDDGPGIANVEAALSDGYTTAEDDEKGLGTGLGAIARMSDVFDIHTDPKGTTLYFGVGHDRRRRRLPVDLSGVIVPKPGTEAGGDIYGIRAGRGSGTIMLMDILGHGEAAAIDARTGLEAFLASRGADLEAVEADVAEALAGSRGAAALIVEVPPAPGTLRAVGLGNVRGEIVLPDGARQGIPSAPGILGAGHRRPRPTKHAWPAGAILVLNTDGLKSAGRDGDPTSLYFREPATIAATLYKRRRRGTDDCGVVVAKALS